MVEETRIDSYERLPRALARSRPLMSSRNSVDETEETFDLLSYWRIIRKRRWMVAVIFLVTFLLVVIGTIKQTPIYRATVLLEIQKENSEIMTLPDLFELEGVSDAYLETQYRILRSASLASRVIDQLNLISVKEFNPPKGWLSSLFRRQEKKPSASQVFAVGDVGSEQDKGAYQNVLERFNDRLSISPVRRSRLVELSFESVDPELAARVINTLASSYTEQNLEARFHATQVATEWLSKELDVLQIKLEKSEDDLQNYARRNGLLFLESEQGNAENIVNQRLRQLQEELTRAQAERYQKESLYRLVEGGDYASVPSVFDSRLMQDLTISLTQLKRDKAELSSTFTPKYPKIKRIQNQIRELETVLAQERERAARRIQNDYEAALHRERLLHDAFEVQEEEASLIAERSVQYNILKREVDTNKQLNDGLMQRMKEAAVSAGLNASNIRVVDPAESPEKPARPRVLFNLAMGIALGLALGVGISILSEYLDNTLKTTSDVERFLGVPALALVPSIGTLNGNGNGVSGRSGASKFFNRSIRDLEDEASPGQVISPGDTWHRIDMEKERPHVLTEAFRGLRTSVLLSTAERPPRSLLVSGAQAGEGKTTVSANLAISLAQLGQRVLLIDGDMRRPSVHKTFGLKKDQGLVSYLTDQLEWRSLVQPAGPEGLAALVCGPVPPKPAEHLSSRRKRTLIEEALEDFSFVVLDSPPILNVADSRIIASLVEGVVLVVRSGATSRDLARRAKHHLRDLGANIIGVVLNRVDFIGDGYYGYEAYPYLYDPRPDESEISENT